MRIYITQYVYGGIPEDPHVTTKKENAQQEFNKLCKELELDPSDPHSDKNDVYQWEVEI